MHLVLLKCTPHALRPRRAGSGQPSTQRATTKARRHECPTCGSQLKHLPAPRGHAHEDTCTSAAVSTCEHVWTASHVLTPRHSSGCACATLNHGGLEIHHHQLDDPCMVSRFASTIACRINTAWTTQCNYISLKAHIARHMMSGLTYALDCFVDVCTAVAALTPDSAEQTPESATPYVEATCHVVLRD